MRKFLKGAMVATTLALAATAAQAQVAVVDLEDVIARSAAMKAAQAQIQAQYKTQIDAFNARNSALNTELQPLQREIQTLQANSATPPATLQAKVTAFQTRQQTARQELTNLAQPFGRPSAYAQEQLAEKVEQALRNAMTAKRVTLVVRPEAAMLALPAADLTSDTVAQLDLLVKSVSVTPPAGWQPGQRTGAAAAPAPTAGQPQGR